MIASENQYPEDSGVTIEEKDNRKSYEFIDVINYRDRQMDPSPRAGHYGWNVIDKQIGGLSDEN
ncbi:hypothetical protein CWD08_25620 [Salmonella enterica]|nr:hypothetical protein [Salmonella enterica]